MILAAEYTPSPLRLMLGRHSGIGNRIPRFPAFCRETGRASPIPDLAGKQGIPDSRFGRERESTGMILAAEYIPSPLRLMLVTRSSMLPQAPLDPE